VTLAQFEPSRFGDPALLDLVAKVKVHREPALSTRYPAGIPNRLTITLAGGKTLVKEVEFPRGHARNPMTDTEVEAKFRRLAEPRFGKSRCDAILETCWHLDTLGSAGDLVKLLQ
jgi:2-methylcitrate dehydratase